MRALKAAVTALVVAVNGADATPFATVTDAGTFTRVSLLERNTGMPAGAFAASTTDPLIG